MLTSVDRRIKISCRCGRFRCLDVSGGNPFHDGNRWYNSATGAFTGQDQNSYLASPANGNRYAYAADNPVNYVDPTGQSVLGDIFDGQDFYDALTAESTSDELSVLYGVLAGVATDAACNFVLSAADVPTAGRRLW